MSATETATPLLTIPPDAIVVGSAATPLGSFCAVFTAAGLACLAFPSHSADGCQAWIRSRASKAQVILDHPVLATLAAQLTAYFEGSLRQFTIPLDLCGTPFQRDVWQALQAIPYGEVRTYAYIAQVIDRPRAVRAVGMANHDNPIPIIVPCHRVIGSNQRLIGYGGGLDLKERLLQLEGVRLDVAPLRTRAENKQRPLFEESA